MDIIDIDKLPENYTEEDLIKPLFKGGSIEVEFLYKSSYRVSRSLRDIVYVICSLLWLSDKLKSRITLVSDELNNNAIEYWSNSGWENRLRIKAQKKGNFIEFNLEVEDNWKWKHPKTALDMETLRAHQLKIWYFEHNSIRGRGLFLIIVQIVDRLYFRNSKGWGLIVWVKKKIKL
jgi:anti-sigma regulatory factor (Ser/Thr protein kinase)